MKPIKQTFSILATAAVLVTAGCATTSPGYQGGYNSSTGGYNQPYNNACQDCGTVSRIELVGRGENVPNATGAVIGGIVGAVAAREIADNQTDSEGRKNAATIAGAAGGAVAGNAIQNKVQQSSTYNVYVRMNDGRNVMIKQADLGGVQEGAAVRVVGGRVVLR